MKQFLFYIENNGHGYKVLYYADRIDNHLNSKKPIKTYWVKKNENVKNKLDPIMIDSLFGAECKKKDTAYRMFITSLCEIPLKVRLKKTKCTVEVIINQKKCLLHHITVNCSQPVAFKIPDIYSFTIVGRHKEQIISNTIKVTEAMKAKLNLPGLLRYYVKDRIKSSIAN